jgi:hypothetical protein
MKKPVIISDVKCHDCAGPVTLFAVPDKVWCGLGLTTEWVCMGCIAKRLNPTINADGLVGELKKQRRRFNLKTFNKFCGEKNTQTTKLLLIGEGRTTMTKDEVMGVVDISFSVWFDF